MKREAEELREEIETVKAVKDALRLRQESLVLSHIREALEQKQETSEHAQSQQSAVSVLPVPYQTMPPSEPQYLNLGIECRQKKW